MMTLRSSDSSVHLLAYWCNSNEIKTLQHDVTSLSRERAGSGKVQIYLKFALHLIFVLGLFARYPLEGLDIRPEVIRVHVGINAVPEIRYPALTAEGLALFLGMDGQFVLQQFQQRRCQPNQIAD